VGGTSATVGSDILLPADRASPSGIAPAKLERQLLSVPTATPAEVSIFMRCSLVKRAFALSVLSSVALANSGGTETAATVRGFTLTGEVMLYPVADQQLR